MKKKYIVAIIVWSLLFAGCSEGHKVYVQHRIGRRPPSHYRYVYMSPPVRYRGPTVLAIRQGPKMGRNGSHGLQRGPGGPQGSGGRGRGRGHGERHVK